MRDSRQRLYGLGAAVLAMAAAVALGTAQPGKAKTPALPAAPKAAAGSQNSCSTCLERRPILDPMRFAKGYEPEVKPSYEAAQKYPDLLDRIHCFCECKESPLEHHKTLLTCFTTAHGAGCAVCQREALLAAQLKDRGASDDDIELTVESLHKIDNHPPTFGRGL